MIENIQLIKGQEQVFTLTYNNTDYEFSLRYSDYGGYWFVDIKQKSLDTITGKMVTLDFNVGLKLPVDTNVLNYFNYLNIGKLALIDTNPDSVIQLDMKNDLGDRLQLYRSI